MENSFSQQLSQQQTQQITPHQLQGLKILEAPLAQLESILAAELESNPLLEVVSPAREELAGDPLGDAAAAGNELQMNEFEGDREDFPLLNELNSIDSESFFDRDDNNADAGDLQKKHDFCFDSLTVQRTLVDILLEQLNFLTISKLEKAAAELIIGSLDERGFLQTHLADIAMSSSLEIGVLENALQLVQSFDPPGVGARSAAESLELQLKRRNYPDEKIYTLLREYSNELERNQLPKIAKAMKISIDELYDYIDELRKLNCIPASGIGNTAGNIGVQPEMSVILEDDELHVDLRKATMPRFRLVKSYLDMLEDPQLAPETATYLKEKLASAEALLKSLDLRQDTLSSITGVIVRRQEKFFRQGVEYLVPMTMAEVAAELDLHETTVSRAVAGKYLATPQGLKEYRFFFSGGFKNAEGEDVSSRGVKEKIKEFIAGENPAKPLSDAAISSLLAAEGLNIARRTVAKYRESLNIPPTNLRRKH